MNHVELYFEGLTKAGTDLKKLLSEAQIRIGIMETYFALIQKSLLENIPSENGKEVKL